MILTMSDNQIKKIYLRDVMTKKVISVSPETPITEVTKIITEHNFDGVPVVDKNNRLVGIIILYLLFNQ